MAELTTQVGSSIDALMRQFDIITHNLANVSTVGYKRRCNAFSLSLEAQKLGAEADFADSVDLTSEFDFSQGSVAETGRSLDFALFGKGFFVIESPEGLLYTRAGVFHTNQNGQVVDSHGRAVAGQAGPITIPADVALSEVNVSGDGTISAAGAEIGRFRLVDFKDNENKLVPVGESCFQMPEEDIRPANAENIIVKQHYQESSNVMIVDELVDMIMVSRLYEANMKFISAKQDASGSLISVAMG